MSCQVHQPDSDTPALALALLPSVTLADDAGAIAVGNKGDGGPVIGAGAEADVTALQNAHTFVHTVCGHATKCVTHVKHQGSPKRTATAHQQVTVKLPSNATG